MTWLARIFLVLTALAPVLLVRAAIAFGSKDYPLGGALAVGVAVLVLGCGALLYGVRKFGDAASPREVKDVAPKEADPLAFLVAYALPLVGATNVPNLWGLIAFASLMSLALYQLEVFYVNPLLAVLGFKFFSAKAVTNDAPLLLLTRAKTLGSGILQLVKISDYFWLQ